MASNAGAKYLTAIKASITFGKRPSTFILGTDSNKPWNKWDILIATAYQIMEEERCSQCGYPVYICHNESSEIRFALRDDTCFAKAKVEKRNDDDSSRTKYKKPFGQVLAPEAYTPSGEDFVTYRESYYLAEQAKRKIVAESRLRVS